MIKMTTKLNRNARYDGHSASSPAHKPAASRAGAGTLISRISRVIAMANTPSLNASMRLAFSFMRVRLPLFYRPRELRRLRRTISRPGLMRHVNRLASLILAAVSFAACGGDSSGPQAGFECLGQALPTTAPASIDLSGQVKKNVLAPVPNPNAIVTAFRNSDTTVALATDTSDTPGRFSVSLTTCGQVAAAAMPAVALAANDSPNVQMVAPTEFGVLAAAAGITPQAGKGFIGVIVTNCSGTPIAGATVSSTPGGTVVYNAGGVPSSAAIG